MKAFYSSYFTLLLSLFPCSFVNAQATTNVYSSVINLEQQGIEYRAAFVPEDGGTDSRFRHRLHYQRPLKENLRWRGVVQGSDTVNGDFDLDFFQAELQWQIRNSSTHGWDSALRFDARISEDDVNANQIGVNWSNQFNFAERWQARAILLTAKDLGDRKLSGVLIRTWTQLRYRLLNGSTVALEMFNSYGRTPSFGSYERQKHNIGPLYSGQFSNGLRYNVGMLFGVSHASTEIDFRFFLNKSF
ncbi:MAG: hypothetical protein P8J61_00425 [Gammaproteobacteria bacterium]|jgi:hypothetical protein|nr:hypothetical protein [Gammaproteobacteria bacterium]